MDRNHDSSVIDRCRRLGYAEVSVETADGMITAHLTSWTRRSLWLVADDRDMLIPLAAVLAVRAA